MPKQEILKVRFLSVPKQCQFVLNEFYSTLKMQVPQDFQVLIQVPFDTFGLLFQMDSPPNEAATQF